MGFGRTKLYRLKDNKADIKDALKRGRAKGLSIVANALYQNALSGNVTAQIFYLKNRSPEEWQDRRDIAIKTTGSVKWLISADPIATVSEWKDKHGLRDDSLAIDSELSTGESDLTDQ